MSTRTNRIIPLLIVAFVLLTSAPTFAGKIIYVDDDGPADFNNIQAAIDHSSNGDIIIISDGTYTGYGNREISFRGKAITVRSENGPEDCIIDCQGKGRGFYFRNGEDVNSVLEGFSITNGYENRGGGIYCKASNPTITNCIIIGNSAIWGGGMLNRESIPTLTNCTFSSNWADFSGGISNRESSPTLTNCTFSGNWADFGGGMSNSESSPTLTNCTFSGNWADFGGGMSNIESSPILTNCTFNKNSASAGGGMFNSNYHYEECRPTLTNCTFSGNSANWGGGMANGSSNAVVVNCKFIGNSAKWGGGMLNTESSPTLTNCTFSGNWADFGGGMDNGSSNPMIINCSFSGNYGSGMVNSQSSVWLINCTLAENSAPNGGGIYNHSGTSATIINCIIWGNDWDELAGGGFEVSYSDIEGGWPGQGNIDTDPCFAELGYWDPNGVWVDGDYHLLEGSPCIDAGDPNYIAEPNETDLDGRPRVIGGQIDMGAYEAPVPAEVRIVPRNINLASKGKWITAFLQLGEDYNVADIDPNSIFLENEIKPERFWISEDHQIAIAKFNREKVQAILDVGEVELKITGQLTDGTIFEATDIIKVTDKAGKKTAK
jgi:hypothetical protein